MKNRQDIQDILDRMNMLVGFYKDPYPKLVRAQKYLADLLAKKNADEDATAEELQSAQTQYENLVSYFATFATPRRGYKSALMFAAENGQIGLMKDLLTSPQADVNEQLESTSGWFDPNSPETGYTALMFAVKANQKDAVDLLLQHYADIRINFKNEADSPLLKDAQLNQKKQLISELRSSKIKEKTDTLMAMIDKLGFTKAEVISVLTMNFDPEVLNESLEVDDKGFPISGLAEYVLKTQGYFGSNVDVSSIQAVKNRLAYLKDTAGVKYVSGTVPGYIASPKLPNPFQIVENLGQYDFEKIIAENDAKEDDQKIELNMKRLNSITIV